MHGEQGALLCTAKIVETVPWIDAKYYAAQQTVDEARHVEAFASISTKSLTVVTRSTRTCGCCSTTSSTTPTGT